MLDRGPGTPCLASCAAVRELVQDRGPLVISDNSTIDPVENASSPGDGDSAAMRRRSLAALLLSALAMLLAIAPSRAQGGSDLENAVKATYLYKFAPFIDWPDATAEFPSGSFTICLVGGQPFGDALDRVVQGQTVSGRPIVVHRYSSVTGNPGCSIMFVTGPDPQFIARTLASVRGTPVLTVTDGQADPSGSGIINFELQDNHVRFAIDDGAAVVNHLAISSKLLGLATRVTGRNRPQ
ncbi:MAG TPA: YfiR family protein [Acetobacteraceae bacterium]